MSVFISPILKLGFEILLLVVVVNAGIRDLSDLAISLIVVRLVVSFSSRLAHTPYVLLDEFNRVVSGILICALKIALEVGIFLEIEGDINVSTDIIIAILFLMALRNVSDTWSLIAIEFDE